MKSTVKQLTAKERELFALFYETPSFMALKRFCALEVSSLGIDALTSQSLEQVKYLSGRASFAKDLIDMIEGIYQDSVKKI